MECPEESDDERTADARIALKALANQFSDPGAPETVVKAGRPAEVIARFAEERGAGLIVMGLTGDQGAFGRRPGSIAYHVLCSANVPVLVVPPSATA